jgi:threonyl-tRNA synthetase
MPVVLHRAVTGSTERFLGVLIEHFAGAFPVWLSPEQAVLIPITDGHLPYCREVAEQLQAGGLRAVVDDGGDRMNAKIRHHSKMKVPYLLVVGDKEQEAGEVALRLRDGSDEGSLSVADFITRAKADIEKGV